MQDSDRNKKENRGSLIWRAIDAFTAFVYSFFTQGRISDKMSSSDTQCKKSFFAYLFTRLAERSRKGGVLHRSSYVETSRITSAFAFLHDFFLSLKLNVYGMFFTFYGLTSSVVYFLTVIIDGRSQADEYLIITSVIIMLCAMPLIFSSQTAAGAIMKSKIMRRVVLDFFCIPPEKLKTKKQYGGTGYIFVCAIVAMILGIFTYVVHPIFVPILFVITVLAFVILSHPETGVIITFAAIPFLQYVDNAKQVLVAMVLATSFSYVCKMIRRRRTFLLSPESAMVVIFCGFILAAGLFSHGGMRAFTDSLTAVVLIMGGFFLTYNLICSRRLLSVCIKTLSFSFVILSFVGVWNGFYNGISDRIMDDIGQQIAPITQNNILYIADNGAVFGMFAVLIFPMLMSYMTSHNKPKTVISTFVLCSATVLAAWMCSHYEIIIAIAIEIVLFWIMYSHRSLTFAIIAAIPIATIFILYPYAVAYFNFPDISHILMEYMPASFADAEIHNSVINGTLEMILDGNLSGIGAGEHAFKAAFSAYSNEITSGADHPSSFIMQILCWSGVFGLVSFAVFSVFVVKRSIGYFIDPYKKEIKGTPLAIFCGLAVTVILGSVYSVWLDERVLFLFWACSGLLMGYVRIGRDDEESKKAYFGDESNETDVELIFYK